MKKSLAATVWETLSAINVNAHCEKKGQLTYLSWAWAWQTLMEKYPASTYEMKPPVFYDDGSCEVWCTVTVTEGEEQMFREMWLPVMDNRNNAVKNPDARQISDTRMRCLVKCLAMLGLGHYIYAGEDLPGGGPAYTAAQKKFFDEMFAAKSGLGLYAISQTAEEEVQADLFNSFEAGKKSANKKLARELEAQGAEIAQVIKDRLGEDDDAVKELIEDEPEHAVRAFSKTLDAPSAKSLLFLYKQLHEAA